MQALNDAGIYLVLDVNNSKYSLNRAAPYISYNTDYLQSVFATVEMFAKYDNTLAFFSGNEVINDQPNTDEAAPFIKAVTRDIKAFIKAQNLRSVPVGYSAADVSDNRMQTAQYMNCGSDDARSDFFAFNDYSWCNSNFQVSGWDQKVKNFTDYGIPILYVIESPVPPSASSRPALLTLPSACPTWGASRTAPESLMSSQLSCPPPR